MRKENIKLVYEYRKAWKKIYLSFFGKLWIFGLESSLVVNRETSLTYLTIWIPSGSEITPLISVEGKPVITKMDDKLKTKKKTVEWKLIIFL
mgnify:CR=1 FL=1